MLEFKVKLADAPLKVTADAPEKFVPMIITLVPAAPFVGEKEKIFGGGLVWPSTLFLSAAATSLGKPVKKVRPVST